MSFRRRKLLHWGVRVDPEVLKRRMQCACGAAKKADHYICHACWVAAPAKLKNDYRLIRDADVIRALREFAASRNPNTGRAELPLCPDNRAAQQRRPTEPNISDLTPQRAALPARDGRVASENSTGRERTQRAARPVSNFAEEEKI